MTALLAAAEVATVPLALDDLVPVVLAGVGCWLLVDAVTADDGLRRAGHLGACLVAAGGLAKAGWKLVLAVTGTDLAGVDDALFVLLAPGFALVLRCLLLERGLAVAAGRGAGRARRRSRAVAAARHHRPAAAS